MNKDGNMRIALMAVDSGYLNLALMKLSAGFKCREYFTNKKIS